jgi:hypothetical protein
VVVCPGCKSSVVREVSVGKRRRAECAGCSRFVGWVSEAVTRSNLEAVEPPLPIAVVTVDSPTLLFVSKRLDILEVSNCPMWAIEAFTAGDTVKPVAFYRLTAGVFVWLEAAGAVLELKFSTGDVSRDQIDEYLAAMGRVCEFARRYIGVEAIRAARAEPAMLPEVGGPK